MRRIPLAVALLAVVVSAASAGTFCTSDLYTYRDRPIESYALTCSDKATGLVVRHTARYDQSALFGPNGRCSSSHWANVSVRSPATYPFELAHDTDKPSAGRRELVAYRDAEWLKPGDLLLNLTWLQDGDELRVGYDPVTGASEQKPFVLDSYDAGRGVAVLTAQGLPLSFVSAETVNGRAVAYRGVRAECEMEISLGDWYGR